MHSGIQIVLIEVRPGLADYRVIAREVAEEDLMDTQKGACRQYRLQVCQEQELV